MIYGNALPIFASVEFCFLGSAVTNEHLTAGRAWALVRDNGKLDPVETLHLERCGACCDWLHGFVDMAKSAGFRLSIELPRKPLKKTGSG